MRLFYSFILYSIQECLSASVIIQLSKLTVSNIILVGSQLIVSNIMSQSIIATNIALKSAYDHFLNGKLDLSIQDYNRALKNTYSQQLKVNIKCTIAVVEQCLGNYDNAESLMASVTKVNKTCQNSIIMLRFYINSTLIDILQGRYTKALEKFQRVATLIQGEGNYQSKHSLVKFATYLFFRVSNLEQIGEYIENTDLSGMKIEELYSMSLMAFNSQLCKGDCQERIQYLCYKQFIQNNRYDLALFSLRALIYFTKSVANRENYERQLAKLVMMGYFSEEIDFGNFEPFEVIQAIMGQFIKFRHQIIQKIKDATPNILQKQNEKKRESSDQEIIVQWKYAISSMIRQLSKTKQLQIDNKKQITQMMINMKDQTNPMVVRSLLKNSYFAKYYYRTQSNLNSIGIIFSINSKKIMRQVFQSLKHFRPLQKKSEDSSLNNSKQQKRVVPLKGDRSKSFTKSKDDKQNNPPLLGISVISITSSKMSRDKQTIRKKIFEEQNIQQGNKKLLKMVKVCEYGCFLNKRNFNSEGGEFKFVKITNSFIKWGKDPQKIETNCQIYPLKDIKSIVYGRVSPNLNENCNKMLNYSKCFSLLLQKRTLDFYCKNYDQLEAWVCGLSHVLKKQGNRLIGYTPGKLRWKKMFAVLKEHFIEPLKISERKMYYYQNAHALKLFAMNGYKLPEKTDKRR